MPITVNEKGKVFKKCTSCDKWVEKPCENRGEASKCSHYTPPTVKDTKKRSYEPVRRTICAFCKVPKLRPCTAKKQANVCRPRIKVN